MRTSPEERALQPLRPLPNLIFASRWLQLPLYLGLIIAQAVYVWLFWQELYYLLLAAMGNENALSHVVEAVTVEDDLGAGRNPHHLPAVGHCHRRRRPRDAGGARHGKEHALKPGYSARSQFCPTRSLPKE